MQRKKTSKKSTENYDGSYENPEMQNENVVALFTEDVLYAENLRKFGKFAHNFIISTILTNIKK